MRKVDTIRLEWTYSPITYLEDPILIQFGGGSLEIKNGQAIALLDPSIYNADRNISEKITQKIESIFVAKLLLTHKDFKLNKPCRTDIRKDGKKNVYANVVLEKSILILTSKQVNISISDKEVIVISDSKKERVDKQNRIANLIEKHLVVDATLEQMLKSYQKSVTDPDDELVHLYEIRDSLSNKFGSKENAISNLKITKEEWDEIGKFANALPLKQGRHRGKFVGELRNAEIVELEKARKTIVYLIEKYLDYLES